MGRCGGLLSGSLGRLTNVEALTHLHRQTQAQTPRRERQSSTEPASWRPVEPCAPHQVPSFFLALRGIIALVLAPGCQPPEHQSSAGGLSGLRAPWDTQPQALSAVGPGGEAPAPPQDAGGRRTGQRPAPSRAPPPRPAQAPSAPKATTQGTAFPASSGCRLWAPLSLSGPPIHPPRLTWALAPRPALVALPARTCPNGVLWPPHLPPVSTDLRPNLGRPRSSRPAVPKTRGQDPQSARSRHRGRSPTARPAS